MAFVGGQLDGPGALVSSDVPPRVSNEIDFPDAIVFYDLEEGPVPDERGRPCRVCRYRKTVSKGDM